MGHCIGIDLGTSFSCVSIYRNGKPQMIPNALGELLTPSVVSIDENDTIIIGEAARERLITHPDRSVAQFKRLMGTDTLTAIGNKSFRPEELSALVLKTLKSDVESFLDESVNNAVISVPAYFNEVQRSATKAAGKMAGWEVDRIISEPTAAAVAYGLPNLEKEMTFLVLDLGGGTFDVTLLELFDSTFEVHASAGDTFLGGNDFTALILDHMMTILGIQESTVSSRDRNILWKNAEQAKKQLSSAAAVATEITLSTGPVSWEISRSEFESFSRPLLDKMRSPVERVISDSGLPLASLDAVVLVGGATRMPMIRDLTAKMLGCDPYCSIDPDTVVASGASVSSALKTRQGELREVVMTDVCPFTLGVEIVREITPDNFLPGQFMPIIERNTTIPASRMESLQTIRNNQTQIEIKIFQGESRLTANNVLLGTLNITVPKGKAGEQIVDIRFTYDVNGLLEVEAFSHGSGVMKRTVIEKNPGTLSPEEIDQRLKKLETLKIHPREDAHNRAIIARGERLYQETLGDTRERVAYLLSYFEQTVEGQDPKAIEEARNELARSFDDIEAETGLL